MHFPQVENCKNRYYSSILKLFTLAFPHKYLILRKLVLFQFVITAYLVVVMLTVFAYLCTVNNPIVQFLMQVTLFCNEKMHFLCSFYPFCRKMHIFNCLVFLEKNVSLHFYYLSIGVVSCKNVYNISINIFMTFCIHQNPLQVIYGFTQDMH